MNPDDAIILVHLWVWQIMNVGDGLGEDSDFIGGIGS